MGVRLVGINHVALEVADIDAALEFYSSLFERSMNVLRPLVERSDT